MTANIKFLAKTHFNGPTKSISDYFRSFVITASLGLGDLARWRKTDRSFKTLSLK